MRTEAVGTMPLAVLAIVLALALVPVADAADTTWDEDLGTMNSMTVQFTFEGRNAETIEWDFGDGSSSTDRDPLHTYARTGEYIVTQTCKNSYGGGSETRMTFRIHIAGYPVVTFDAAGGSDVAEIVTSSYGAAIAKPADPSREGYVFNGWFVDEGCEEPYDWESKVVRPMTLHAGWTAEDGGVTVSFLVMGGSLPVPPIAAGYDGKVVLPVYEGEKAGFTFAGWSMDGDVLAPGTELEVAEDTVLSASWTEAGSRSSAGDPEGETSQGSTEGKTDTGSSGSGGIAGFVSERPLAVAAAVAALAIASLVAVRAGRA